MVSTMVSSQHIHDIWGAMTGMMITSTFWTWGVVVAQQPATCDGVDPIKSKPPIWSDDNEKKHVVIDE